MGERPCEMNPGISACLIARNEATHLERCLLSIRETVDEMVLVDTGSIDHTIAIARKFGARVIEMPWSDDFSVARNAGLRKAQHEVLFIIDADEELVTPLRPAVTHLVQSEHRPWIARVLIRSPFRDARGSERVAVSHVSRLCSRDSSIAFRGAIHEQLQDTSGLAVRVAAPIELLHHGYNLAPAKMQEKQARNVELLQHAIEAATGTPESEAYRTYLVYQLGKAHMAAGRAEEARIAYAHALAGVAADATYRPELLIAMLYTLKELGLQDEVWPLLLSGLQQYPDFPDLHFFMAVALAHFKVPDLSLIERCYQTCLNIGEKHDKYPSVEGTGSYLAQANLDLLHSLLSATP
ncbi:MAG: glycosyltransferase family 2 protein [Firmicutes bacterium]|nr:glycosyltransferase family 2 protein [Bacillota bacterium]